MDLFQRPSVSLDLPEKLDFGSNDQSVEEESLLPKCDCKKGYSSNFKSPRFALGLKSWLAINLALSVLNLGALLSCVLLWHAGQPAVARQTSECLLPPSPAIDVIDKEFHTFPLLSSYTEEPSPEVDQMWNELVNLRTMFYLDGEELATVNDCPETAVRGPKGHYVAALAATHQIHCVDSLRKGLYFHYKYYQEKQDPLFAGKHHPPEGHLMHCVELLRNAVMCAGDVSVITYNWKKDQDFPEANFGSVTHACQKWDKIDEWRRARNITAQLETLERPAGVLGEYQDAFPYF